MILLLYSGVCLRCPALLFAYNDATAHAILLCMQFRLKELDNCADWWRRVGYRELSFKLIKHFQYAFLLKYNTSQMVLITKRVTKNIISIKNFKNICMEML